MSVCAFRNYFLEQYNSVLTGEEIEEVVAASEPKAPNQPVVRHLLRHCDEYFKIHFRRARASDNLLLFFIPSHDNFFKSVTVQKTHACDSGSGGSSYVEPCTVTMNKWGKVKYCILKRPYAHSMRGINHTIYLGGLFFRKEAAILNAIHSMSDDFVDKQHIVNYIHSGVTDTGVPYIILERLSGGTLQQAVPENRGLRASDIKKYAHQLLFGVRFIGRCGMSHQDLKADNVMFATKDRKLLKIIDFDSASAHKGLAADYTEGKAKFMKAGSSTIKAPEYFVDGKVITEKSDLWSAGLLILFMAVGQQNYTKFAKKLYSESNIHHQDFIDQELSEVLSISMVNPTIQKTISGLLIVDVARRFTAEQALFSLLQDTKLESVKLMPS